MKVIAYDTQWMSVAGETPKRPTWLGPGDGWVPSAGPSVTADETLEAWSLDDVDCDDLPDEDDTEPVDERECRPDEVEFALEWNEEHESRLSGTLLARNISHRAWRLSGVPELVWFAETGVELDVPCFSLPVGTPPVHVPPGATATSEIGWTWDGTPVQRKLGIRWPGGFATLVPSGPLHPQTADKYASAGTTPFMSDDAAHPRLNVLDEFGNVISGGPSRPR